ncbi:MAG TPA: CapA family protein [Alphaproteobacteria bacterium]|nr:CapA family protein [Alphaproteobacteria bacterium]
MTLTARLAGAALAAFVGFVLSFASAAGAQSRSYRVIGAGDIMMGSNFPSPVMHPKLNFGVKPATLIGAPLAALLRSGDVVFGNMEGTIHTRQKPSKTCQNPKLCYVFRSPPFHADILKSIGFNMVSMANNHAGDFFGPGRDATWKNLKRVGLIVAGYDEPDRRYDILTLNDGTRVGIIGFGHNPGLLLLTDIRRAKRLVGALAKQTDFTIVSFHGGAEGSKATRVPRQMEIAWGERRGDVWRFSHAVVDAGADIVFGHGPHVPRAVEVYKGRFIAYSLGNFWTYGRFNLRGLGGVAPVADLRVDKTGRLLSARIHSVRQPMPGVPQIDPSGRAARIIADLTAKDFPERRLRFTPNGIISGPGIGAER